jgi:hypothetical protein
MWDDESPMLWSLGNSPEEIPKKSIKGKDMLGWFIENGVVYEYIRKPLQKIMVELRKKWK